MLGIRPFQIVLLGIFAMLAIGGVIFFMLSSGVINNEVRAYGDGVEVWGTLDARTVNNIFAEITNSEQDFSVVDYRQFSEQTFNTELLNAIAEGRSPDLVVLPSNLIVQHRAKLVPISFDSYSERTFRDTYIDGAEVYLFSGDGIYGLPFAVDPLVMYWNRDLFASNGLASAPSTWTELLNTVTPALVRTSSNFTLSQSAVAFGEYANVRNAKAILSLLFLQAGNPIVMESSNRYSIVLEGSRSSTGLRPAEAVLSFYTGFALPSAAQYSWSRSLPEDRLQFIGGNLGLYFGFGSEYEAIQRSNPNLNFDVAEVPQDTSATVRRGFGTFYAFAIPRAADNVQGAFAAAKRLADQGTASALAQELNLAPVHRAEITGGAVDPYRQILYAAALISRSWLDPNPVTSDNIFRTMVEDVTSGRSRVSEAVGDAAGRLEILFQ